ncbi:MAG: filamentous hemagglutinin N-terminal domain-containing protein, partial [Nitrospirales bacterium]
MRRCLLFHQRMLTWNLSLLVLGLSLPCLLSLSLAQAPPITPSGLDTHVSEPIAVGGQTQYNITGGTRPGGGTNLFHSFGDFGVPANHIANFQNTPFNGVPPATSNILGRVTGGDMSNIFGAIQTTGFGNANLFLMNPAGFLFGPNATVNVGGMVAFSSADYLRLAEIDASNAGIFHADPAQAGILTNAPVAAFGFLGSNPGAIIVQGSQVSVSYGKSISLVGGNVTIQSGTLEDSTAQAARLSAPNGIIQLASAESPGEFDATILQPLPNVDGVAFASSGSILLAKNSIVDVTGTGTVSIRGGQFVLEVAKAVLSTHGNSSSGVDNIVFNNASTITAATNGADNAGSVTVNAESITFLGNSAIGSTTEGEGNGGLVSITAPSIQFHENSNIRTVTSGLGDAGDIELQGNQVTLTESSISARTENEGRGGNITIRGLTGEGSRATDVRISGGSRVATETFGEGDSTQGPAGNILVETARMNLSGGSLLNATSRGSTGDAGTITINATDSLTISGRNTLFSGSIDFSSGNAGHISINAPSVLLDGSNLLTETQGTGQGGNIEIINSQSVTLTNGATLSASSKGQSQKPGAAGNINVTATNSFTMQNSTITTEAGQGVSGGNIKVTTAPSGTVLLENSRISASATEGGKGGNISIDPQSVILLSSQILAQAAQGQGGAIMITTNLFLPDANSIVNADSGSGLNGTVTIQSPNAPASGKIQPLGNQPLEATSLLSQRCAALAGGEFSSFTVTGQDSLP